MPHINEKIDLTAEVFVVNNNKVLLRKHDKYGIWLSVGGHIELNEDPNQAAIREVKEEVGLDIELVNTNQHKFQGSQKVKELITPLFINRHHVTKSHEHVTLTFIARSKTDNLILSEKEKTSACKWFKKQELLNLKMNSNIKHYALTALDLLKE